MLMASHAFDSGQVVPDTSKRHALTLVPPLFTRGEDQVIALARRDSIASIRPGSWLTNMARRLFGIVPANPLADPRLEAIRRFAVAARHGHGGTIDMERRQFLAAGFSPGHADFIMWRMTEKLSLPTTKG
jgi:hypothetical protein